ncbi:DM13 domain-containing protein [Aureibaculum sp. 2210JD6-5]|nr:DM13 domain-containing protein [Aureibaculum sp. 2210JD6-5]MDY7394025.1 DM13 domain-containing protein [Aureibaculum sp. 2210JD6-5]
MKIIQRNKDDTFAYNLPSNVGYSKYSYVVIWYVDFSVSFGYAIVK